MYPGSGQTKHQSSCLAIHSDRGAAWTLSHTACPVCQALTLQKPEAQSPWEVVGFLGFKILVVAEVAVRQAPLGPSVMCTLDTGIQKPFEDQAGRMGGWKSRSICVRPP